MSRIPRILIYALLISLLIHILLLGLIPKISWPDFSKKTITLQARIVPPEKPIKFKPLAPPVPKAKRPAAPESQPGLKKPASAPVAQSTPIAQSAPSAEKPARKGPEVPMHAKLVFNVIRDNAVVGRAVQTWDISDDGHYKITSTVGAIGIFSLFVKGEIVQTSEGRVTDVGLRPDRYTITRGSEANRQEADFDWQDMKLDLISNGTRKQVDLLPMTQDQLSFLYQFGYTPPRQGIFSFHATDGRKLDIYDYQIVGEEEILSGTMKIKTIHLRKLHQQGVEGTEIWLDEDHYYWPAQVLMTDRKGDSMRQLITSIEEK